jgi:hypothetical protein
MLLKYLLMTGGFGVILVAVTILGYDIHAEILHRRALATPGSGDAASSQAALGDFDCLGIARVGTNFGKFQHCHDGGLVHLVA